jgi:hypothetical protein
MSFSSSNSALDAKLLMNKTHIPNPNRCSFKMYEQILQMNG